MYTGGNNNYFGQPRHQQINYLFALGKYSTPFITTNCQKDVIIFLNEDNWHWNEWQLFSKIKGCVRHI